MNPSGFTDLVAGGRVRAGYPVKVNGDGTAAECSEITYASYGDAAEPLRDWIAALRERAARPAS